MRDILFTNQNTIYYFAKTNKTKRKETKENSKRMRDILFTNQNTIYYFAKNKRNETKRNETKENSKRMRDILRNKRKLKKNARYSFYRDILCCR